MDTYVTKSGDYWDEIALKTLGSVEYTGALMAANMAYRHYYTLPPGIILTLPVIAAPVNASLPPWKKIL